MKKEGAPLRTATVSPDLPRKSPRRNWNSAFKRLVIALGFFVAALIVIAAALSHVNPSLLVRALTTFFGWSLPLQSLAVVVALIVVGAVAGWKQIYQSTQSRRQRPDLSDAGESIEPWLARIYGLLANTFARDSPIASRPPKSRPGASAIPEPPPLEEETGHSIGKPQDDVQLTPPETFIGRRDELRWLEDRLIASSRDSDTTVIIGITGVGKTALATVAIETAKNRHNRFRDGIVRVPCTQKHDAVQVVRHALERVDHDHRLPATVDLEVLQQVSEELLGGKDILILLDGVGPDIPLGPVVRALRTQDRSAHILITTNVIPSVNVAPAESQLHLKPLQIVRKEDGTETDEALELFARYAGMKSAADFGDQRTEASAIVAALDRHTYSLQLVGGLLQVELDILPLLAEGITTLKDGHVPSGMDGVLQPMWVAHTRVVNVLPDEPRRLLYAFGAFGTEEAGRNAVHTLGERLGLHDTDGAIHTLVQCQLMESFITAPMPKESDFHRLRIHTLLRAYLVRRISAPEWQDHYARAKDIIAEHYAEFVQRYDQYDPHRSAQRALTADAENIARALDWAIEHDHHAVVAKLAHGMRRYWHDRWLNERTLRYMPTAVDSAVLLASEARQAKDAASEKAYLEIAADLAFTLGRVLRRVGKLEDAEPLFQHDLEFRRRHRPHDYADEAQALHQLAQLERSRGRMRRALRYCREGLAVVRRRSRTWYGRAKQLDNSLAQAKGLLLAQQGRIERSRGNLRYADRLFVDALALFEQTGDPLEQGVAWGYRGRIVRVLGDLPAAQQYFERSDELARQVFDFRGQGIIATQLGRIARIRGDMDAAEQAFTEGLNKARQVFDRQAEAVNLNYLGRIARSRGKRLEAEDYFRRSLELTREIGDRLDEGMNLGYLGRIALDKGFLRRAHDYFRDSLKILREVEDRRGEALILANLAAADMRSGKYRWAKWRLRRSLRLICRVGDKRSEGNIRLFLGQLYFETGNIRAARTQFTTALLRAQSVEDCSGMAEAQQWLDKTTEARNGAGGQ